MVLGYIYRSQRVSTHAPLAGSDILLLSQPRRLARFNPRSPCGERRAILVIVRPFSRFNPRSPCGERQPVRFANGRPICFNPRSPCGERPLNITRGVVPKAQFQPTLPLRGATGGVPSARGDLQVSTHAPLAGSDGKGRGTGARLRVSTHAPLAGSDGPGLRQAEGRAGFNPRSPCGERPHVVVGAVVLPVVSTHAPLAGSDFALRIGDPTAPFQPTLPLRGATLLLALAGSVYGVSTHAPLAGSDWSTKQ